MKKKSKPAPRRRLKSLSEIHVGAKVYWHDPAEGACSRWGKVTHINGDDEYPDEAIITIDSGTEVFLHELS
jgi:hypothetical protein